MTYYRIYALDRAGHIRAAFDAQCENDDAALAFAATAYGSERLLEVWQGDRCVGTLPNAAASGRQAAD